MFGDTDNRASFETVDILYRPKDLCRHIDQPKQPSQPYDLSATFAKQAKSLFILPEEDTRECHVSNLTCFSLQMVLHL